MPFDFDEKIEIFKPKARETAEDWGERRMKIYENLQNHGTTGTPGHCKETKESIAFVKKAISEGLEGTFDI